jgi:hypothetical protein
MSRLIVARASRPEPRAGVRERFASGRKGVAYRPSVLRVGHETPPKTAAGMVQRTMPWQRLEDPDARETRMPRLRIVLAIFLSLAAIIALWLFGAWLASRFFLH